MACFRDVLRDMPKLRRVVLLSGSKVTQEFYARELGMWDTRDEENLVAMTRTVYKDWSLCEHVTVLQEHLQIRGH